MTQELKYFHKTATDLFGKSVSAADRGEPELETFVSAPNQPYTGLVDNQAALQIAKGDQALNRTKHIDIRVSYVRDAITSKFMNLFYVNTQENLADPFTKPLAYAKLIHLLNCD
jgi:hypothetical protein